MTSPRWPMTFAIACLVGSSGCGSGSDSAKITTAANGFYAAEAAGDAHQVCDLMSEGSVKREARALGGNDREESTLDHCAGGVKPYLDSASAKERKQLRREEVYVVRVHGHTATVRPTGYTKTIHLRKEDGDWKLVVRF